MTLQDEGWEPVTALGSRGKYTWRVWCDPRRPPEADVMDWPKDRDYLATFIEAVDDAGRQLTGGIGGIREPGERVRYWTATRDGFLTFVGVRFAEDLPRIVIETTRRIVEVDAASAESYYGMRFYAMPLDEGEDLVAVAGGNFRTEHVLVAGIPAETGYFPLPGTAD
jgi:hypothetical protein